ncbi:MAG: YHS domain-containing protein [Candidatus Aminicenantes bacterium]|jgi:YHS domain-containing protein
MKHLIKVFVVLVVVSFLLAPFGVLNASDTKAEKAKKHDYPMSGKDIDKDKAKFKAEYKGTTYYFCCEKCKTAFEKDPEKYLKETKDKCCEGKVFYVCPMKQCNVKTDKPGKCPKCGMDLKKVVEFAAAECEHNKEEHKQDHHHKH